MNELAAARTVVIVELEEGLYQNAIITPFFSTSCTINGSQFRRAEVYINLGLENH